MSLNTLLTQPVTILSQSRGNDVDEYGNDLPAVTATAVTGYLEQKTRAEKAGAVPIESWLLVLRPDVQIEADDRVFVGDHAFVVDGAPWPVWNPRTRITDHQEATLTRSAGGLEGQGS
jgi:hypothetical protein